MKATRALWIAALVAPLFFSACRTHTKVDNEQGNSNLSADTLGTRTTIERVRGTEHKSNFVTSKLKFTVQMGDQKMSLTGNLRMKRDRVIRLQLMAFGLVEAARLEFTQDYVLIMDRINKQYLMAPYSGVSFLANSGINFYTLQALFWDQLFYPNMTAQEETPFTGYTLTPLSDTETILELDDNRMHYSWLVDDATGRIRISNIKYQDVLRGNTQLSWEYRDFKQLQSMLFPSDMHITLTTPEKQINLSLLLNYLGTESDWEERTAVSNKYRKVTVDEILSRFLAL